MSTVIKVEDISKQYRLGNVGTGTLAHDLNRWWYSIRGKEDPYLKVGESNDRSVKGSSDYVWALRDINFEVKDGQALGIIGNNGAGKSTLLKILSRVTSPSTGSIKTKGRVASLLEVGTGFHPELTGRENIFLNGAILGMTHAEVKRKLDEIIDFSGVERYIETPVKRYSSGMYVRLAFAVAAHLEPEILIVDEVLAVGDADFQKKCLGKMKEVAGTGRTILFVSHNMAAIETLCDSSLLLRHGTLVKQGSSAEVISYYLNPDNKESNEDLELRQDRTGTGTAKVIRVEMKNSSNLSTNSIRMGEPFSVDVYYKGTIKKGNVSVMVSKGPLHSFLMANSFYSYQESLNLESGKFTCYFDENFLLSGNDYTLSTYLGAFQEPVDHLIDCFSFAVEPADVYNTGRIHDPRSGVVVAKHHWNFY